MTSYMCLTTALIWPSSGFSSLRSRSLVMSSRASKQRYVPKIQSRQHVAHSDPIRFVNLQRRIRDFVHVVHVAFPAGLSVLAIMFYHQSVSSSPVFDIFIVAVIDGRSESPGYSFDETVVDLHGLDWGQGCECSLPRFVLVVTVVTKRRQVQEDLLISDTSMNQRTRCSLAVFVSSTAFFSGCG